MGLPQSIKYPYPLHYLLITVEGHAVINPENKALDADVGFGIAAFHGLNKFVVAHARVGAVRCLGKVVHPYYLFELEFPDEWYFAQEVSGKVVLVVGFEERTVGAVGIKWQEMKTADRWIEYRTLVTKKVVIIGKVQAFMIEESTGRNFISRKTDEANAQLIIKYINRGKIIIYIRP